MEFTESINQFVADQHNLGFSARLVGSIQACFDDIGDVEYYWATIEVQLA